MADVTILLFIPRPAVNGQGVNKFLHKLISYIFSYHYICIKLKITRKIYIRKEFTNFRIISHFKFVRIFSKTKTITF